MFKRKTQEVDLCKAFYLQTVSLLGAWFGSTLRISGSVGRSLQGTGSKWRPREHQFCWIVAWKPTVVLRFSINLHTLYPQQLLLLPPWHMVLLIILTENVSFQEEHFPSFTAVYEDECFFPFPPLSLLLSRNFASLDKAEEATATCPTISWLYGNSYRYYLNGIFMLHDFYRCFCERHF